MAPTETLHRFGRPQFPVILAYVLAVLSSLSAAQTATTLHVFTGGTDGGSPSASVSFDSKGNLYGTTWYGGDLACGGGAGCGVIFEEAAPATSGGAWTYSALYSFTGGSDGCCQLSTPAIDSQGRLYGVTNNSIGGQGLFQFAPVTGGTWQFTRLHTFDDPATYGTQTPLSLDKAHRIYAASYYGGLPGCNYSGGCGSVVQFVPPAIKGGAWTENTVYLFQGGADGGNPSSPLVAGAKGVFYDSAAVGGLVTANCPLGCGVVYQLTPPASIGGSWTETVIYTFQDKPDGADPYYLTAGPSGSLYGLACCHGPASLFHVFQLIPPALGHTQWTKAFIHSFSNTSDGANNIVMASNGVIFGAAFGSLDFSGGDVFQLTPPATRGGTWSYRSFTNLGPSRNPNGVTPGPFGALYGTLNGGDSDAGLVFSLR